MAVAGSPLRSMTSPATSACLGLKGIHLPCPAGVFLVNSQYWYRIAIWKMTVVDLRSLQLLPMLAGLIYISTYSALSTYQQLCLGHPDWGKCISLWFCFVFLRWQLGWKFIYICSLFAFHLLRTIFSFN